MPLTHFSALDMHWGGGVAGGGSTGDKGEGARGRQGQRGRQGASRSRESKVTGPAFHPRRDWIPSRLYNTYSKRHNHTPKTSPGNKYPWVRSRDPRLCILLLFPRGSCALVWLHWPCSSAEKTGPPASSQELSKGQKTNSRGFPSPRQMLQDKTRVIEAFRELRNGMKDCEITTPETNLITGQRTGSVFSFASSDVPR